MDIRWSGEDRTLEIALVGELDHHAAQSAMQTLGRLLDERLPLKLNLDLSSLSFMDSSGIAVVLGLYKRIFALSGTMTVQHVPTQAMRVFTAAGIDRIVDISSAA